MVNGFSTKPVAGRHDAVEVTARSLYPDMKSTLSAGLPGAEPLDQLAAAHLGHDQVGEHEVDRAVTRLDDPERLGAVARLEHGVARGARAAAAPSSGPRPRPRPAAASRCRWAGSAGRRGPARGAASARVARQEDRERGALARRALDGDVPAALLDDAVHGREPEAGALARRPWW